jgi:antitoxin MazE
MTHVTVGRWGKSLALRLPSDLASEAGLREGEQVDIETQGDAIVIRRLVPQVTAEELFAGKSSAEWQALYADLFDWGPDAGREIVENDRPGLSAACW